MKKQILISLVLLITGTCYGQFDKIKLGVTGSFDYNSYLMVKDFGPENYKGKLNSSVGALLHYPISKKTTIGTGIAFSTKNWKTQIDFRNYIPNPSEPNLFDKLAGKMLKISFTNSYLDVPLLLNSIVKESDKKHIFVTYGFVNSFRIAYGSRNNLNLFYFEKQKSYHNYLFAFKTGLGYGINTSKWIFNVMPQMRFYIKQVHLNKFMNNPVHLGLELQIWRK